MRHFFVKVMSAKANNGKPEIVDARSKADSVWQHVIVTALKTEEEPATLVKSIDRLKKVGRGANAGA